MHWKVLDERYALKRQKRDERRAVDERLLLLKLLGVRKSQVCSPGEKEARDTADEMVPSQPGRTISSLGSTLNSFPHICCAQHCGSA